MFELDKLWRIFLLGESQKFDKTFLHSCQCQCNCKMSIFISLHIFSFIFVLTANDLLKIEEKNKLLNFSQNWILSKVKKVLKNQNFLRRNSPKKFCIIYFPLNLSLKVSRMNKILFCYLCTSKLFYSLKTVNYFLTIEKKFLTLLSISCFIRIFPVWNKMNNQTNSDIALVPLKN